MGQNVEVSSDGSSILIPRNMKELSSFVFIKKIAVNVDQPSEGSTQNADEKCISV